MIGITYLTNVSSTEKPRTRNIGR